MPPTMGVGRIFQEEANSGCFKGGNSVYFMGEGETMVKCHFTNSENKRKAFFSLTVH